MFSRLCGFLGEVALALMVATTAYEVTASSTVPASRAGDGSAAVSGYTAFGYQLHARRDLSAEPQRGPLTVSAAPVAGSTLKAQLKPGGALYACSNAGTSVTCATTAPQATAVAATQLTLVVAD